MARELLIIFFYFFSSYSLFYHFLFFFRVDNKLLSKKNLKIMLSSFPHFPFDEELLKGKTEAVVHSNTLWGGIVHLQTLTPLRPQKILNQPNAV